MELELAIETLKKELKQYGLEEWSAKFNKRYCSFGLCSYDEKTIYLSEYLVKLNDIERVLQTIKHEIAHALLGPGHGHSKEWKELCIKIGGNGIRCYTEANTVIPPFEKRYTYICTNCGKEIHKSYLLNRPRFCKYCCETLNFGVPDNKYMFKLVIK